MSAEALPNPEVIDDAPVPVECAVLVYLVWDDATRKWVVDPVTVDGQPLDRTAEGVTTDGIPYSQLDDADQERVDNAVLHGRTPTAVHLARMILDAAGSQAHEVGDTYRKYLK